MAYVQTGLELFVALTFESRIERSGAANSSSQLE